MTYITTSSDSYQLPTEGSGSYTCPSILNKDGSFADKDTLEKKILGWLREAVDEGTTYLRNCKAYDDIDTALDIILNQIDTKLPNTISKIHVPIIKRDLKEVVAILSNIRPSWRYEPRANEPTWQHQARIQNGLSKDWYERNFIDREIKKLLQLGVVEGTSYMSNIYNPYLPQPGGLRGGIELKLYRYNEVLPVQLPKNFNLQNAYAVILKDEMGINRARAMFPHKAHKIVPDRVSPFTSKNTIITAAQNFWSAIWGENPKSQTSSGPVVDILYIYVNDYSYNPTDFTIPMGEASWAYEVPSLGSTIPDGYTKSGELKTRAAKLDDCKMYPNRRLIIATRTAVLYDGPSYWWHGQVPIIKYSPDDWIFSYLGFSMAAEVASMQDAAIKMRRSLEDALHLTIDPPLAIDQTMAAKTVAESTSIRTPGRRIRTKLAMGEMVKPILNPSFYKPGAEHFAMVKEVEERIKDILCLPDLQSLQKAKQVPSSDSIEKFFSQAGAVVKDMALSLDKPLYELADMNRYYFYQFYTVQDRIKILGKDGITEEDFDFDPGTLVPQALPNEPLNSKGVYDSTRLQRAKIHINNFRTSIERTSAYEVTNVQRKLLYMQATKINPLMVSPETLAKVLGIENWGKLDGDTEIEKIKSAMKIQEQFGLKTKFDEFLLELLMQKIAQSQSPEGQLGGALNNLAQAVTSSNGENGQKNIMSAPVGRPPTFSGPPKLEEKGDRTTITNT